MNVSLASFHKRVNSTKVPDSFSVTYPCILKDSCSILKPVISLDISLLTSPSSYNYAEIPSFDRYYYIKNWTFNKGLWNAELEVDFLASHKADILESYAYVVRCSKFYDGDIIDTFYPAKVTFTRNVDTLTPNPFTGNIDSGTYIVGIINEDSSIGAVSYYAFNSTQFEVLKYALLHDCDWTDINVTNPDIGLNLYKSLFNPFQYITSIKWFPVNITNDYGTVISSLKFGWWNINGITCIKLTNFVYNINKNLTFTEHPLYETRGNYLNITPYSKYVLFVPAFGEIELDSKLMAKARHIDHKGTFHFFIDIDLISGIATLRGEVVGNLISETYTILILSTQLSIEIQLAQIYTEGNVSNVVNTGTTGLIEGAKTFSNAVSGILDLNFDKTIDSLKATGDIAKATIDAATVGSIHFSQIGSNGSLSQFIHSPFLASTHMDIVDEDNNDFGRPYCKHDMLYNFSPGYVQTLNAHVASFGYREEIALINIYLDGGVYLE